MYKLVLKKGNNYIKSEADWFKYVPPKKNNHWRHEVTIKMLAEYFIAAKGYIPKEIEDILKALKLACYPLYASNGLVSPTIFFRFGQFTCKGYLESVSYTWKPPIIDNKYMVCDVSIGPIYCSPKSVNEGSASELIQHTSMAPFGNSEDSSESNFGIQGGSTAR